MNDGFSLIEVLIALTISVSVFSLVVSSITQSVQDSQKLTDNQVVLESIFHTVDSLKTDLTKCGMRLQEAGKVFSLPIFSNNDIGFDATMGLSTLLTISALERGENYVEVEKNDYLKKKKSILIYNLADACYEFNEISAIEKKEDHDILILKRRSTVPFTPNSVIVVLKKISFKYYIKDKILKRKTDNGYFQPMIENVTDFYLKYFSDTNSLLYRIEVGHKEQIRGYIFLSNMVPK